MGLAKVIGIILLIGIIILGVVAVDVYQTANAVMDVDPATLISNPNFENVNNEQIKVTVVVSLPKGGFIPKGAEITVELTINGTKGPSAQETVNLGETKTLTMVFSLDEATKQALGQGKSIEVEGNAVVVPIVLGYKITQATQTLSLGKQTISGS